jgi:hypothetical protein
VPVLLKYYSDEPLFVPGQVLVTFVVDKVALRQVFLRLIRFSPVGIIPLMSYCSFHVSLSIVTELWLLFRCVYT